MSDMRLHHLGKEFCVEGHRQPGSLVDALAHAHAHAHSHVSHADSRCLAACVGTLWARTPSLLEL